MQTYELISQQILTSDQFSITFSNIPQTYNDLSLIVSARTNRALVTDSAIVEFNGIPNSGSAIYFYGDGSTVASTFEGAKIYLAQCTGSAALTNTFGNSEAYIPNYTLSNNKLISVSGVNETNATQAYVFGFSNLWPSPSAISSMTIKPNIGPNFTASSSFYLYGIKNVDDRSRGYFGTAARGGDEVYTVNGYKVHVFKNSGTFEVTSPGEVEYLVVGGGGGGGNGGQGGGGAGGLLTKNTFLNSQSFNIIIGAGGNGGLTGSELPGNNGSNTFALNFTALGGGGGGGGSIAAGIGGSGGGGRYGNSGGAGTSGQGNSGGNGGPASGNFPSGGGGGAGAAGAVGANNIGGKGGDGILVFGNTYAGGGGGGVTFGGTGGSAGSGGGGAAGTGGTNNNGASGVTNTGGGGGAGAYQTAYGTGGNGGSGIVIIRYKV